MCSVNALENASTNNSNNHNDTDDLAEMTQRYADVDQARAKKALIGHQKVLEVTRISRQ